MKSEYKMKSNSKNNLNFFRKNSANGIEKTIYRQYF